jgi:diguanylate cyclase (GGDEF)-like protein
MKRVLIIDDTAFIREEILAILRFEGYEVLTAETGAAGIELALRRPPDLILCDVMMPGLDGYQVLAELRRDPRTVSVPFVFMTVLDEHADIRRGMNLGADDYLIKPIRRRDLLDAVRSRLERHETLVRRPSEADAAPALHSDDSSRYDPLTGLPNRRLLPNWLAFEIDSSPKERVLAVLVLVVDRFEAVHNALGPKAGEEVIRVLAERLRGPDAPSASLFRSAESEFVLILPRLPHAEAGVAAATRLLQMVKRPLLLARHTLHMTASMGLALHPQHGADPEALLAAASLAVQEAREQGGSQVQTFQPALKERVFNRLNLETHLRQALQRKGLGVHYQPQVDLRSGRLVGFEALVRWDDPELGRVSPAEFVPVAEQCGLIQAVGAFVLQSACLQAKALHEQGWPGLAMAVNVSSEQFRGPALLEDMVHALMRSGLDPSCLHLELTEGSVMRDPEESAAKLQALKTAGVRIALDDFGTGYSSLAYLRRFPLDTLKIDQSFIRDVTHGPESAAITATIIELGHRLGLQVLAEGIETAEQASVLQAQGCDAAQGYHYSKPLPPEQLAKWLSQ